MAEIDKLFLKIDGVYRLEGDVFGKEWNGVMAEQIGFLLERPLMFRVLTEKVWGPAKIDVLGLDEWKEAEDGARSEDEEQEIEELADMTLLLLTSDSLNPKLLLPSQRKLLEIGWNDTVRKYCDEIGLDRKDLIPAAMRKIKINKLRNPPEAFVLVPGEDLHSSEKRMEHNWKMLKKKRNEMPKKLDRKDWWKKSLYVDDEGRVQEKKST